MTTRIQRTRKPGWRKPQGVNYIGYGTKYGNPHKWKELPGGKAEAHALFRRELPELIEQGKMDVELLRGKILMCWCKQDEPCHGDVIIEHLNKQ